MRFVSHLILFWWVVRTVDAFVPFLTTYINHTISFIRSGSWICLRTECYPQWQAKLIAMGTDRSVANTLVLKVANVRIRVHGVRILVYPDFILPVVCDDEYCYHRMPYRTHLRVAVSL